MERPGTSILPGWGAQGCLKDTSSTDVVVHAGKALTPFINVEMVIIAIL